MAIDLFANYERTANSSVFYRTIDFGFYGVLIRLMDLDEPNKNYNGLFTAEYSINGGPGNSFPLSPNGHFEHLLHFNSEVPSLCTIRASLKTPAGSLIKTYEIGCRFVLPLPAANFILYPKHLVQKIGTTTTATLLHPLNLHLSPGTSFYGEGHTETFYLSSWNNTTSLNSMWFVGNPSINLIEKAQSGVGLNVNDSFHRVLPGGFLNSGIVSISTTPNEEKELPVSFFVYDNTIITPTSPIITYDDLTGEPNYYPYFYSTQNPIGNSNSQNFKLRDTIRILSYPNLSSTSLVTDLTSKDLILPFDYTNKIFNSSLIVPPQPTTPVTERFIGSEWNVMARSVEGNWGDVDDLITNTGLVAGINSHSFPLKYDNIGNGFLDYFTASSKVPTTITLQATSVRDFIIDPVTGPFDWLPRRIYNTHSVTNSIQPLPFGNRVYTPNYFNLKNEPVRFELLINNEQTKYRIKSVVFSSSSANSSKTITTSPYVGILTFRKTGLVDLQVFTVVEEIATGIEQTFVATFLNIIEIVETYDEINESYYYTDLTEYLKNPTPPYLSPNEWVTNSAINSVVDWVNNLLVETEAFSFRYEKASCFYGWMGLNFDQPLVWQDSECPLADEMYVTWEALECPKESCLPSIIDYKLQTWENNECPDPNTECSGEHCVKWRWDLQKAIISDTCITWKEVDCEEADDGSTGEYGSSWESNTPCETDSEINCPRSTWHICTIDPEYFPFSSCLQTSFRCNFATVIPNNFVDQLVVLYNTEVHLVSTDYFLTKLDLKKFANQTTRFQNIVSGSISNANELFVLDSVLSQVSVFKFIDNKLELINSWGKFGYRNNVEGLNNPTDLHVDQNNNILIADNGNKCIKKFSFNGQNLGIYTHPLFETDSPRSVCVDSKQQIHVLLSNKVVVLDYKGQFLFEYQLKNLITEAKKINTSYNRETVYITFKTGVAKYFRTGQFSYYIVNNHECLDKKIILNYNSIFQDRFRNLYITVGDRVLKIADRMRISQYKSSILNNSSWINKETLYIKKHEYVQPWVYIRLFHKLWDNIEILRNSLFYDSEGCKQYTPPVWDKKDFVIGQNEIVSNAVINRLISQLWDNLKGILKFFDNNCRISESTISKLETCCKNRLICDIPRTVSPEYLPPIEPTCDVNIHYEGGVTYPRIEKVELGRNLGYVSLISKTYAVPDRFVLEFDGNIVLDTGYHGDGVNYGYGGALRLTFIKSLSGRQDPVTGNFYPFANSEHEPDGFPIVDTYTSIPTFQFYKNSSSSLLTLSAFGPMTQTLWDIYVSCPGQPKYVGPCGLTFNFPGGISYPSVQKTPKLKGEGTYTFIGDSYLIPDRFVLAVNNVIQFDTKYISGVPSTYNTGGTSRPFLTAALMGKIDFVTGNSYPFVSIDHEVDGFPKVLQGPVTIGIPITSNSRISLSAFAPDAGTAWEFKILCPGENPYPPQEKYPY